MVDQPRCELSDTERFWDEKARTSQGDPLKAVCRDSVEENECIDRVQRTLARSAMERIGRIRRLTGAALLDYGCGSGRWVDVLRRHGCRYTGVDISAAMVAIARREHPDTEFRKIDGVITPYADASFDLVWSVAVVHHNPPDRQEQMLGEFVRVLRDGGVVVLLEGVGRSNPSGEGIYYPRTRDGWTALAARHGLSCRWRRGASYFALRFVSEAVARRIAAARARLGSRVGLPGGRTPDPSKAPCTRWAARVDAALWPHLAGFLPPPLQRRVIMVFEKGVRQQPAPARRSLPESSAA